MAFVVDPFVGVGWLFTEELGCLVLGRLKRGRRGGGELTAIQDGDGAERWRVVFW